MTAGCNFACYKSNLPSFMFHIFHFFPFLSLRFTPQPPLIFHAAWKEWSLHSHRSVLTETSAASENGKILWTWCSVCLRVFCMHCNPWWQTPHVLLSSRPQPNEPRGASAFTAFMQITCTRSSDWGPSECSKWLTFHLSTMKGKREKSGEEISDLIHAGIWQALVRLESISVWPLHTQPLSVHLHLF